MPTRHAHINRQTAETKISVGLNLDEEIQTALPPIQTGIGFFDHMLTLLARHSLFGLTVQAEGDLRVDMHHTVEDVGLCLGEALAKALGDKKGIARYGSISLPMDEALANVAIDLSGRSVLVFNANFTGPLIGDFATELVAEFLRAFATAGKLNLHVTVPYGSNNHHIAEAIFKGLARALRQAAAQDPRETGIPSSKGVI